MKPVHPIHIATLLLALAAAVFAYVAMQVAFEARDNALSAASQPDGDNGAQIDALQSALIRAGVIEDPWAIPDDHGEPDGPWARCLTADERGTLDLATDDAALPAACDVLPVRLEERCPEPMEGADRGEEADVADESCELRYVVDDRAYDVWDEAHPADVAVEAEQWFRAEGEPGVDRVARGPDGTFLHVIDRGWLRLHANE
ncbi:MAG: hypothetical protein JJT89_03845 [Nitriliruptoraceae bacterium]|nr:hypothetical protein [Nitriliruptoraceae bacterium]